jgi:hypothetical protein
VLVARRRLDRGDDLTGDAQLGEAAEARLAVTAVIAHGLVEADQPLLHQIVAVAAEQEVGRGLEAHESVVAPDDALLGVGVPLLGEGHERAVVGLRGATHEAKRRRVGDVGGHGTSLPDRGAALKRRLAADVPPLVSPFPDARP